MTQQKKDILLYKNSKIKIWNNILHDYFEKYPERLSITPFMLTSLWRGYFADFEIKKNELFIVALSRFVGFDKNSTDFYISESILDKAFPNTKKCEFFSGYIRIDDNFSDLEKESFVVLEIKKGDLIKEHNLSFSEFQKLKETEKIY